MAQDCRRPEIQQGSWKQQEKRAKKRAEWAKTNSIRITIPEFSRGLVDEWVEGLESFASNLGHDWDFDGDSPPSESD